MNRPKITIITPSLGLGGAEQWVRTLVTHGRQFQWVVCVLANNPRHDIIVNSVVEHAEAVYAPEGVHPRAIVCGNMAANIKAAVGNADLVICWGGGFYWPLPTKNPIIFVGHGTCQWTVAATKQAYDGGVSHFVAVSDRAASAMRAAVPDVSVILNGVDTTRLAPPKNRDQIRLKWYSNDYDYAKYIGYVGRLGNEKNIDGIIYAVASLPYHYRLVFVGCTGWRAEPILSLARTVLRDRLVEVPATDSVGEQLGSLDCVVQVSPREGNSLLIAEAMLCRTPIISTITGAIPQFEQMAGRELVEKVPDDPIASEIAAAIRRVCTHPPVERVVAAEQFARQHLTEAVMVRKWTQYLYKILYERSRETS